MTSSAKADPIAIPTYTIIQADGLYPDDTVEQEIFQPRPGQNYAVKYIQTNLWPTGVPNRRPWSDIDPGLREQVDGIMVLKMSFKAEDLALFPRLKV
ncbi:hypothetical protein HRR78_003056 [Exophiala dermatitidis]|nr:hypothetical protein HRR75_000500 [Exophiala dermatitidis]KAJ4552797.1 hypothetical protein HRR78_003056 [Exophiala dermatitidis]